MKNKKLIFGFIALLVVVGGYFVWESKKNVNQEKEVVKIGAILPLTGQVAFLGNAGKNGLEFAEYYFNNLPESKYEYKFIFEDGQANPTKSLSAFNKLISSDKVISVFSTISAVDLSLIPSQSNQSVLFFSHSSHPELSNVNKYFFRHSNTVEQEAEFILSKSSHYKSMLLVAMNDEYGIAFQKYLSNKLKNNLNTIEFTKGEIDFSQIALKISETKSEYIVICGSGQNLGSLVNKIRELGDERLIFTTIAYTASGADANTKTIKNLNLVQLESVASDQKFSKVINEFQNKNQITLGTFDLIFFNSAYILLSSINKTGLDKEKITKEISLKKDFDVIGGNIRITNDNDILPRIKLIEQ